MASEPKEVVAGLVILGDAGLPGTGLIVREVMKTRSGVIRFFTVLVKREWIAVLEWIELLRLKPRSRI
jgi:hypothetical protein